LQVFVVGSGDRKFVDPLVSLVAGGEQTGGALAVLAGELPARTAGPPLHVHRSHDEAFFVLEGTLTFAVDDEEHDLGQGDFAWAPRGSRHTFANRQDEPVRFLGFCFPSGIELMLAEFGEAIEPGSPPDLEKIAEIGARYDSSIVGPPLSV
jgi:mannose-6-phosphate isomerase-like protein (cupin superfamily)